MSDDIGRAAQALAINGLIITDEAAAVLDAADAWRDNPNDTNTNALINAIDTRRAAQA